MKLLSLLLIVVRLSLTVTVRVQKHIHVFLPSGGQYPESSECMRKGALAGVTLVKERYPNITIDVEFFIVRDHGVISDPEITGYIVEHYYNEGNSAVHVDGIVGTVQSVEALEMATFFQIPTVTYTTMNYQNYSTQVPLNPSFKATSKSILNILRLYEWTRVNFVISSHPWYTDIGDYLLSDVIQNFNEEVGDEGIDLDPTRPFKFILDSPNKTSEYYSSLSSQLTSANIIVVLGHQCEVINLVTTAFKQGHITDETAVVYIDPFGNLEALPWESPLCSELVFSESEIKAAFRHVILGRGVWRTPDTDEFYKTTGVRSSCSGLEMLMVDGMLLLASYLTQPSNTSFVEYSLSDPQVTLFSGPLALQWDEQMSRVSRGLDIGVNWYHLNGNVSIGDWRDCPELYCPKLTIKAGTKPVFPGGTTPTSDVKDETVTKTSLIVVVSIFVFGIVVTLLSIGITLIYRRHEAVMSRKVWLLNEKDLNLDEAPTQVATTTDRDGMFPKKYKNLTHSSGRFKNCDVFIKSIQVDGFNINDNKLALDLVRIHRINHDNINPFIGLLPNNFGVWFLQSHAPKGSLMDLIRNNPLNMNNSIEFKVHVLRNIAEGMMYLHQTINIPHGNLKSTNCVIDSRWVVKISDIQLASTRACFIEDLRYNERHYAQKLWSAPELLNVRGDLDHKKMKMADVYSFAIISSEVYCNSRPYAGSTESYSDIIQSVKDCTTPAYRPKITTQHCNNERKLFDLVKNAWSPNPTLRNNFSAISSILRTEKNKSNLDFGDVISSQMQLFTANLDEKIKEMEDELEKEKENYETLLHEMLPKSVATCIKAGRQSPFENFSEVTIYFSDITNFAKITKLFKSDPVKLVNFLDQLYHEMDDLVELYKDRLYKVETINDAYMVVSGLPVRQKVKHAAYVTCFALNVLSRVLAYKIEGHPLTKVMIRIGIHSGGCAAGVIGKLNPRYCLFGDTVNFTSRLESTGSAFKIHTSEPTIALLQQHSPGLFHIHKRTSKVTLKNRGTHQTYFITGMEHYEFELPLETSETLEVEERLSNRSRKISRSNTSSCSESSLDTGISSALHINIPNNNIYRRPSCSVTVMNPTVKKSIEILDMMKEVPQSADIFEQPRSHRRAFSQPNKGYINESMKVQQRISIPFRKESDLTSFDGQRNISFTQQKSSVGSLTLDIIQEAESCTPVSDVCDPVSGVCDPVSGVCDPVSGVCDPVSGVCDPVSGVCDQLQPLSTMFSEGSGHNFSETYNHITGGEGEKVGRSVSEVTDRSERSERSGRSEHSERSEASRGSRLDSERSDMSYKSSITSDSIADSSESIGGDSTISKCSEDSSVCSVVQSESGSQIHSVRTLELLDSADRISNSARGMGVKRSIERKVKVKN